MMLSHELATPIPPPLFRHLISSIYFLYLYSILHIITTHYTINHQITLDNHLDIRRNIHSKSIQR
jgi:hypothetical protein